MLRADAEVLLRGRGHLQADDVALLEDVVAEAAHMANLADTMLNLARLDAPGAQIEQDVVDLAGLATDVGRRVGPLAAERGVSVEVEAAPTVLVVGDRVMLEQAVLVLIDNAIKYNRPGGRVLVRVSAEGNRANLAVKDTGIGIASEHLPHLGERFYRVDKARSREAGGAGLGVSIAQSIASRHRGSLQYESEAGEGTTATLSLPLARAVRREEAVPEVASG
jgi:signal transduction histidine kinase